MTSDAGRRPRPLDVLRLPAAGRFLRWRHARTALQLPVFLVGTLMVLDGLIGPQLAPKNLATVLTWVHYRGLAVLALLVAGNAFCLACPFVLVRNAARRLVHPIRHWPRRLRHKWLAAGLLALFLFAYELFDLWASPWWTAWVIVAYAAAAVGVDGVFRGAAFCKYVCPLGQFNFLCSTLSPLEVKVQALETCAACRTKDCIRGRPAPPQGGPALRGCELGLYQARKVGNLDCTFCLDCVHACPHGVVGLSPRLPAGELWDGAHRSGLGRLARRPDWAALAVIFSFGALLNAFGMVTPVYAVEEWLAGVLRTRSEAPVLAVLFVGGLAALPAALLGLASWLARRGPIRATAARYAVALVPLGFGVWLAHYSFHFLTGLQTAVPVVQSFVADLAGRALLGAPRWTLAPPVPQAWLLPLELGFLGLGWLGSLLVAYRLAENDAPGPAWRAFWPWAGLLSLMLAGAIWLMAQPMEMRAVTLGG